MTQLQDFASNLESGQCRQFELPFGDVVAYSSPAPYKLADEPNEDSVAIIPVEDTGLILVVADGVGGGPAGEEASRTVIDSLVSSCRRLPHRGNPEGFIIAGIEAAQQQIRLRGDGAASTVAIAQISDVGVRPVHIGDSTVLVTGQRGKLKLTTIPHSPVGYAVESGFMSEKEAFTHEDRHLVSNVVGGDDMFIAMGALIEASPLDTVVVGSDGLFDNVRLNEVIEIVRTGALLGSGEQLVKLAVDRMQNSPDGKPDDISFLLFRRHRKRS